MTPTPPTKASALIIRHLISAPPHRDYGTAGFFFFGSDSVERPWDGSGPHFRLLNWGGRSWSLDLTSSAPGLISESGGDQRVLAVESVSAVGRTDSQAFTAESLVGYEARSNQVSATYRPQGWSELEVRVIWNRLNALTLGMEIQVSTRSVGELKGLEIGVLPGDVKQPERMPPGAMFISPRDPISAQYTYDGRMSDLSDVITLGVKPYLTAVEAYGVGKSEIEPTLLAMYFREDISRDTRVGTAGTRLTRIYCLGHDLERGVILRARIRLVWLPVEDLIKRVEAEVEAFSLEPLPLGT